MDIPVSLVENDRINLPLNHDVPIHVHVTIPFSLLVPDCDPNSTPVPKLERPRCWLATRLFGRQYETPTDAMTKTVLVVSPAFHHPVWPKLSALLFGKEQRNMYTHLISDATEWEHANASNISWAFSTGVTDDDIDNVSAVVLKAGPGLCGTGGILFTVEEMGERHKAAWKRAWMELPPPMSPGSGESGVDLAMDRKNNALSRFKAGWLPQFSSEKESFESA
jgi:hypothetical protein